jgi:hypothetical protein
MGAMEVVVEGAGAKKSNKIFGSFYKENHPPRDRPMDCLLFRVMQAPC